MMTNLRNKKSGKHIIAGDIIFLLKSFFCIKIVKMKKLLLATISNTTYTYSFFGVDSAFDYKVYVDTPIYGMNSLHLVTFSITTLRVLLCRFYHVVQSKHCGY